MSFPVETEKIKNLISWKKMEVRELILKREKAREERQRIRSMNDDDEGSDEIGEKIEEDEETDPSYVPNCPNGKSKEELLYILNECGIKYDKDEEDYISVKNICRALNDKYIENIERRLKELAVEIERYETDLMLIPNITQQL